MTGFSAFALRLTPMRLRFGEPAAPAVAAELEALGLSRAVVLGTPGHADAARAFAAEIGTRVVGTVALAQMHTPVEVTGQALAEVMAFGADALVTFGGGSVTGLGKALALRTDLPQIAVPTTYAGSEVTAVLGQTDAGRKTTITNPRVQPEVIVYDPRLITGLPPQVTVTSGLNALAHAAEALYARERNPLTTSLAVQGIEVMVQSLPQVLADLQIWMPAPKSVWRVPVRAGPGTGGDEPASQAVPHPWRQFRSAACRDSCRDLALCGGLQRGCGTQPAGTLGAALRGAHAGQAPADRANAGRELWRFARGLGAPISLKALGMKEEDLARAAKIAAQDAYWNPRPVDEAALLVLLKAAWAGDAP